MSIYLPISIYFKISNTIKHYKMLRNLMLCCVNQQIACSKYLGTPHCAFLLVVLHNIKFLGEKSGLSHGA